MSNAARRSNDALADELERECTLQEHFSPTRALLAEAAAALRKPEITVTDADAPNLVCKHCGDNDFIPADPI